MSPKKVLAIFLVLLLPISVSAGPMGDFLNSIFRNSDKENLSAIKSVQNMALLAAAIIPPVDAQASSQPTIEKDALVPDVAPSGDVKNAVVKPTSDQINIYVVREGDTLSQIAEMFDVNVNTIKWSNDLTSNTLKTGQTLVILPISGVKHTIVKGDTLSSLAKKYKGDVDEIIAYNNLKQGETLTAGEIIIIPDGEVVVKTSSGSSTYTNSSGSGLKEYSGYYMRPIAGGRRTQGIHGYNGVDLAAPVGTPIFAAADGEVIISRSGGWNGGYGNYIVIRHANGTQTLYAHNSKNNVSVGDTVSKGDTIGAIGSTGKSTGPHIHFEIRGAKNPF